MLELDHLVIASPHLDDGCLFVEKLFGIRPTMGGSHSGIGTRNALLGLSDNVYIEVLAPDPEQKGHFALKNYLMNLASPHLSWWAVRCSDISAISSELERLNVECNDVRRWSRGNLSWQMLMPRSVKFAATMPFFIQWDDMNMHPARTLSSAGTLNACRIAHPDVPILQQVLDKTCSVCEQPTASVSANVVTTNGVVELATPTTLPPAIGSIG